MEDKTEVENRAQYLMAVISRATDEARKTRHNIELKYLNQALTIIKEQQAQLDRVRDFWGLFNTFEETYDQKAIELYGENFVAKSREFAIKAIQNYILGEKL
jgi:hypothetical protein